MKGKRDRLEFRRHNFNSSLEPKLLEELSSLDEEANKKLLLIERDFQRNFCQSLYKYSSQLKHYATGIGYFNPELLKIERIVKHDVSSDGGFTFF